MGKAVKQRIGIIIIFSVVIAVLSTAPLYRTALGKIADLYVIENGEVYYLEENNKTKTLVHLTENGTILFQISLPKKEDGLVVEGKQLIADENGNCYIWMRQYEKDGTSKADYIQIYDTKGKKKERLFYQNQGEIKSFQRYQDELVVFGSLHKNEEQLCVYRYNLNSNEEKEPLYYPLDKREVYEEYLYVGEEFIFLVTYEGELLRITSENTLTVILPEDENGEKVIPYVLSAADGVIYFTDGRNFNYYSMLPETENFQLLYKKDDLIGEDIGFSNIRNVYIQGNYLTGYHSKEYNGIHSFIIKGSLQEKTQILRWKQMKQSSFLLRIGIHFILAVMICTPIYFLCWWLWNRRSLMVKLVLLICPLMASLSLFLAYLLRSSYTEMIQKESYDQLYMAVYAAQNNLNIENFKMISLPLKIESESYKKLNNINLMMTYLNQRKEKEMYLTFYLIREKEAYVALDLDTNSSHGEHLRSGILDELTGYAGDYVPWFLTFDYISDVDLMDSSDNDEWMYYAKTVRDETGVYGYIEAGLNKNDLMEGINQQCSRLSILVILAVLGVMLVILLGIRGLLKNLQILKQGVIEIASGNWGTVVDIVSRDEMQEIGNSFNRMSDQIVRYFNSIEQIQKAYEQFTPKQMLSLLEANNVLEAIPGKHIVKPLILLSVTLGNLTHREEFSKLNEWIQEITAQISDRGGVVESFQGAQLQAIFNGQAEEVLEAAISIMGNISSIPHSLYTKLEVCITIQAGKMTFGVVGDETRRNTMLMAEQVHQNYQLVQFARRNHIPVLITEALLKQIKEPQEFLFRELGILHIKEQNKGITIYELCNVYSKKLYDIRRQTRPFLEEGIQKYQMGLLKQARRNFIDIIRVDHTDEIAKMYLFLCEQYDKERPVDFKGWIEE